MLDDGTIDKWGIVQLYVAALKKSSWIEATSLGYTLLEIELRYLLKSKAGLAGEPLEDAVIEKSDYLVTLAELARDKKFLPQRLFEKVKAFNAARKRAIHKLATETVKLSELEAVASSVSEITSDIQRLWLPYTLGSEMRVG